MESKIYVIIFFVKGWTNIKRVLLLSVDFWKALRTISFEFYLLTDDV